MDKISTVELVCRLLEDEYNKQNMNMYRFAQKVRVNRQSIINLIGRKTTYIKSDYLDTILSAFELSLTDLEKKYGSQQFKKKK